jgi:hypothetical protein
MEERVLYNDESVEIVALASFRAVRVFRVGGFFQGRKQIC